MDTERRQILAWAPDRGETRVAYDYLVLATGFVPFAPGLKSLDDAQAIRAKLLRAKYPQSAFPELELLDTGVFEEGC